MAEMNLQQLQYRGGSAFLIKWTFHAPGGSNVSCNKVFIVRVAPWTRPTLDCPSTFSDIPVANAFVLQQQCIWYVLSAPFKVLFKATIN